MIVELLLGYDGSYWYFDDASKEIEHEIMVPPTDKLIESLIEDYAPCKLSFSTEFEHGWRSLFFISESEDWSWFYDGDSGHCAYLCPTLLKYTGGVVPPVIYYKLERV